MRKRKISNSWNSLFLFMALAISREARAEFAYVTNNGDTTVSVIDTSTNTIVGTIQVGMNPFAVVTTPDGNSLYVSNYGSNDISVVDANTNTVVGANIQIPGGGPEDAVFTSNGLIAYVPNNSTTLVSVIDTITRLETLTIDVGSGPAGMALNPKKTFLYVANEHDGPPGTVSIIDTNLNMTVATVTVGSGPAGVAITPDGSLVFVTNASTPVLPSNVSIIETVTNTIIATVTVGITPARLAITPDGLFAYVPNSNTDDISIIDTSSPFPVVATIGVNIGSFPFMVRFTPDGTFAYVSDFASNEVSVIDTRTRSVVATIPGFDRPSGIAFASPAPPETLYGRQKINDFGLSFEFFNKLKWPSSHSAIAGYFVYRNGVKIARLDSSTTHYRDHDRKEGVTYVYAVTAFTAAGNEGTPIYVTVTPTDDDDDD